MKCQKIKKRLSVFVDGEVKEKEKNKILAHLSTCAYCAQEAKTLFSLQALLEEEKETIKPSPYFTNKLEQRIAQLEKKEGLLRNLLEYINRALVPATITSVLIIGTLFGNKLGEVFYSRISKILNPGESSSIQEVVDQSLYLNSLDDFPSESLGGVYIALITENQSSQSR
jgi:predicted anti-sigma-YlaC factor YlaD